MQGAPRQLSLGQPRLLAHARAFAPEPQTRLPGMTATLVDRAGALLLCVTRDPEEAA